MLQSSCLCREFHTGGAIQAERGSILSQGELSKMLPLEDLETRALTVMRGIHHVEQEQ